MKLARPSGRAICTWTLAATLGLAGACGGDQITVTESPSPSISLRGSGIGLASFGEPQAEVIQRLSAVLGQPQSESDGAGVCPLNELDRLVRWDGFNAGFRNGEFAYYSHTQSGSGSRRYTIDQGIGPGSTLQEIQRAYGDELVVEEKADFAGPLYRMRTGEGDLMGEFGDVLPSPGTTRGLFAVSAGPGCI